MNKDLKLPPYQRLKSIFNEGELTDRPQRDFGEGSFKIESYQS